MCLSGDYRQSLVRLGPKLSEQCIAMMRHLKLFFGVDFEIKQWTAGDGDEANSNLTLNSNEETETDTLTDEETDEDSSKKRKRQNSKDATSSNKRSSSNSSRNGTATAPLAGHEETETGELLAAETAPALMSCSGITLSCIGISYQNMARATW
eukprot:Filipodium_phascolosomae@DN8528_c0_g1_i1.p1